MTIGHPASLSNCNLLQTNGSITLAMFGRMAQDAESEVELALNSDAETARVEFKSTFNPDQKGELLEIIKDIVAMANSAEESSCSV